MKGLLAILLGAVLLAGCGSDEAAKPSAADAKDYKPETGKLSELQPGGAPQKGAGTGSAQ